MSYSKWTVLITVNTAFEDKASKYMAKLRYTGPKSDENPPRLLNFGLLMSFLFTSYIGNNKNLLITDEMCWSLNIRYCGA